MTIEVPRHSSSWALSAVLCLAAPVFAQVPCTTDAECSDGVICNGLETCQSGACVPGVPEDCCSDADCDDEVFCNGPETCQAGACVAGVPPSCDDSLACTTDGCNNETSACVHTPPDADGDGHADAACLDASGNPLGDDCDDADVTRFAGAEEICDDDDEDCDPSTFGQTDSDEDGFVSASCCNDGACGRDCDDERAGVHPIAPEVCNGIDEDCDGEVDDGATVAQFADLDGDGHGDASSPLNVCAGLAGHSPLGNDCDDANAAIVPGAMICSQDGPAAVLVCSGPGYVASSCTGHGHTCFTQPNGTGVCEKGPVPGGGRR